MYIKRKNAPSHLINIISNDKHASLSANDQQYYEYLLGKVKKDTEEVQDHIEIRPDILGQSEIIHVSNQLFQSNSNDRSNHQD